MSCVTRYFKENYVVLTTAIGLAAVGPEICPAIQDHSRIFRSLILLTGAVIAGCSSVYKSLSKHKIQHVIESPSLGSTQKQIINWEETHSDLIEQAKDIWPWMENLTWVERMQLMFYVEGNQMIGYTRLINNGGHSLLPNEMQKKLCDHPLCLLDRIEIAPHLRKKGHGRQFFDELCHQLIDNWGYSIILIDTTLALNISTNSFNQSIGDELYGGERTRRLFDVSASLISSETIEYLLEKKAGETKQLEYWSINATDSEQIIKFLDSARNINHLIEYIKQHPSQKDELRKCLISLHDRIESIRQSIPASDDRAAYDHRLSQLYSEL